MSFLFPKTKKRRNYTSYKIKHRKKTFSKRKHSKKNKQTKRRHYRNKSSRKNNLAGMLRVSAAPYKPGLSVSTKSASSKKQLVRLELEKKIKQILIKNKKLQEQLDKLDKLKKQKTSKPPSPPPTWIPKSATRARCARLKCCDIDKNCHLKQSILTDKNKREAAYKLPLEYHQIEIMNEDWLFDKLKGVPNHGIYNKNIERICNTKHQCDQVIHILTSILDKREQFKNSLGDVRVEDNVVVNPKKCDCSYANHTGRIWALKGLIRRIKKHKKKLQ